MHHAGNTGTRAKTLSHETGKSLGAAERSAQPAKMKVERKSSDSHFDVAKLFNLKPARYLLLTSTPDPKLWVARAASGLNGSSMVVCDIAETAEFRHSRGHGCS
ncbi:hypothetical protein SRHO_G00121420 [Serrasalmus rhombeus]